MYGKLIPVPAIPLVPQNSQFFPTGSVTFAVEVRDLSDDAIETGFADDPEALAHARAYRLENPGDALGFVSIHVLGPDGLEYLRFDDVKDSPHFHYCYPAERSQLVFDFDTVSGGDFLDWVFDRLRSKLPDMLAAARAPVSVDAVAGDRLAAALAEAEHFARASQPAIPASP